MKLLDIKMKSGGDPKETREQISEVENERDEEARSLDKDYLIAVVLHAIDDNYVLVLTSETHQKVNTAILVDLKEDVY